MPRVITMDSRHSSPFPAPVLAAFEQYESRIAFVYRGRTTTYGAARDTVHRLAHALEELGFRKPDAIAFLTRNSPEAFLARLAAQLLGLRIVSLDPMYATSERWRVLADADVDALVHDDTLGDGIRRRS